ncbi:MAG: 30S ribosomal protein S6 [Deltaproteobacteria bacterium]|nr:30S ribosomal protein S6 [Deltaproteobacteria bacterium]MBW2142869.1 30S ribosomal protein S6 [Deltaproteobacteria bacterium]
MKYYETLYIINPNLSDEEYRDVVTKFNNVVEKKKGVAINVDEWGKKSLAYKIKKFDKGYYVLSKYCGEGDFVAEFERDMNLDERILKFQTIKLSDQVDPEELKAEAEEVKKKENEKAEAAEEKSSEKKTESETKQEGNDGVQ